MIAVGMHFSWKLHSLLQPQTIIRNLYQSTFSSFKINWEFQHGMYVCVCVCVSIKFLIKIIAPSAFSFANANTASWTWCIQWWWYCRCANELFRTVCKPYTELVATQRINLNSQCYINLLDSFCKGINGLPRIFDSFVALSEIKWSIWWH